MSIVKYHKDGPFIEPVVRCDSCNKLVMVKTLRDAGVCPFCSNTKVRNVRTISSEEIEWAKEKGIDPEWIALFDMDNPIKGAE